MKRILIGALVLALVAPASQAATKKPTPTPTKKTTSLASKKPAVAATKKAVPKKKVVRKKVKPSPSPKPVWPPKGFVQSDGVYAKVPTGTELVSLLSASTSLAKLVTQCEIYACGAVYVASATECTWWEVNSTVYGPSYADITNQVEYGKLRVTYKTTPAKQVTPIFLVSTETRIPNEATILEILGISKTSLYTSLSKGKSLAEIADAKSSKLVKEIMSIELKDINARLAAGEITSSQAQDQRDELPNRVANELARYRLTVGGINVKCWIKSPEENIPSTLYVPTKNR
ncbi:MAG: hypothetical protein RL414_248 [Actinomycetota bacterium]